MDVDVVRLEKASVLVLVEAKRGERPCFVYAGPAFERAQPSQLKALSTWQYIHGGAGEERAITLSNELGTGTLSPPGLIASRERKDWAIDLRVDEVRYLETGAVHIRCLDVSAQIAATYFLALSDAGVLTLSTAIENLGDGALTLDWCSAITVPLDPRLTQIMGFTGQWAGEFQTEELAAFQGSYVRENRAGRTSHESFPGLILKASSADEVQGLACGFHLAWSGNHRACVDRLPDGRGALQMGELLWPGEMRLAQGERYQTPDLLATWSVEGVGAVSRAFHSHLTQQILDKRALSKPRPVHFNTWEAVYFFHEENRLIELAEIAASVGAERFVLDDGWFGSRRGDASGLGDWWVSPEVYPDGLHPIVDKVRELGMEFGLWFEPEMVNPDSDLYRAHPDWVLGASGVEQIAFRNQLTLNLSKPEVAQYLYEKIAALVDEYRIDYIKWDMNRDTHHPGDMTAQGDGRAVMHKQTLAVYALIDRLREAFPSLEIESCSSGGGRADYGILQRTDRIWTSDNNDARARQHIQKGASFFFPLRVLGSHVGPKKCHITGRRFTMEYRVASALFGHMGLELDLARESDADREVLAKGIALYKKHRALLHSGTFHRLASAAHANVVGVVDEPRKQALFSYALVDTRPRSAPDRLFFAGLDRAIDYRVKIVWPLTDPSISRPSIIETLDLMGDGPIFSGAALMDFGMQTPPLFPDSAVLYHLQEVSS
ncbi:alpha-galactosidase [Erythrobacter sp. SCSIO 43205]|uniref:alpha-galactosidase n=1 Tax=Erythrobacter sp. SCSIO 43205 TaxID=2779361 RepID=UPI001CA914B4|nr:alpha-galactosidase [Erythrobacter sp. SCSIO 43205]UAB77872.1 alpha-galactosidase [Erythrobacter sp. SCSIO 43205]